MRKSIEVDLIWRPSNNGKCILENAKVLHDPESWVIISERTGIVAAAFCRSSIHVEGVAMEIHSLSECDGGHYTTEGIKYRIHPTEARLAKILVEFNDR